MTNFRLALVVAIALIGGPLVAQADGGRGHHGGGGRHHGGWHGGHHGFHGHHRHHGIHSGIFLSFGPIWYPGYYYYHYPRPIVIPPAAYIEQSAPQDPYYWYYCPDAQGYYPYVNECPSGWLQVVPQASPPR